MLFSLHTHVSVFQFISHIGARHEAIKLIQDGQRYPYMAPVTQLRTSTITEVERTE